MTGFFSQKETESKDRPGGRKYTCIACGAYKSCDHSRMEAFGDFEKEILIVGSDIEKIDDREGKPFQSRYGVFLEKALEKLGVNLFKDCLSINACRCYVEDKENNCRIPTNYEIECCRKTLLKLIEDKKPKLIIILGNSALFSLIGHRWKKDLDKIDKWRGWTIPDQDYKCWVCPTYEPKQVYQWQRDELTVIWKEDLKEAIKCLDVPFPVHKEPTIKIIEDLSVLSKIRGTAAFDYETTGIKPHAPGHRIVCCSIATSEDFAYVFMMPKTKNGRQPFVDFLLNPKVRKIAQNMKFEETWSSVRLKTPVVNWHMDTMLMTHCLDNRSSITNVKFQTYVRFGVVDYASEVAPYLKADDNDNGNAINKIDELLKIPGGEEKLLIYCGYDSIYEFRLAMLQKSLIP